jgi:predicted anti-sigma-YlaC factor YlaD
MPPAAPSGGASQRLVPCKDIQSVLFDYMAHELGEKQSWLVHEHLLHCEECRREAASIQATLNFLKADTSVRPPEHLSSGVRRRLERAFLRPLLDWCYVHRRLVASTAALVIVGLLLLFAALAARRPERVFWTTPRLAPSAGTQPGNPPPPAEP